MSVLVMCSIAITFDISHESSVNNCKMIRSYCLLVNYLLYRITFVLSGKSNSLQSKQETLLWQKDRVTCLSVEILQLQNILFENWSRAYHVALFA